MDAALVHFYRLVWADVTMLLDASTIYYSRKPLDGYNLSDFARGLSALVKHEEEEEEHEHEDRWAEEEGVVDFSEDTTAVRQLLWQFTHGVVLEFIAEELSQFPFWAAKVHTVVTSTSISTSRGGRGSFTDTGLAVLYFFHQRLSRGGVRALFEASAPYLAASAVTHHQHLQHSISFFLRLFRSHLPRHASGSVLGSHHHTTQRQQQQQQQLVREKKMKKKKKKSRGSSVIGRLATALLVHPLLLLSVRMLTSDCESDLPTSDGGEGGNGVISLVGQHWLSAVITLVTASRQGVAVLYTGLRISLVCALFPLAPWYTLGVPETILYRRMAGQGRAVQSSAGGGGLGSSLLGGSYAVLCEALVPQSQSQSQRGSLGSLGSLLSFGLLSVCQVGVGSMTFAATRALLWLVCGSTRQRQRQYRRRKEVLEELWPKTPQLPFFPPASNH